MKTSLSITQRTGCSLFRLQFGWIQRWPKEKDWAGFQRAVCSFIGVSKVIMFKGTGPIVLASPKNVKIINQMRRWNSGFQKLRRSTKLLGRSGPKTGAALDASYLTVKKWLIPILEKYHGRNPEPLQIPTDIEKRLQKIIPESNCRLNRMVDIDLAMYEYDLDWIPTDANGDTTFL